MTGIGQTKRIKRPYRFIDRERNKALLTPFEKAIGVYTITCIANGRVYVGCSTDLYVRICVHVAKLRSRKHVKAEMVRDFHRFGEAAFDFEVIQRFDCFEAALEKERELILTYAEQRLAYNKVRIAKPKIKPLKDLPPDRTAPLRRWMEYSGKTAHDLAGVLGIKLGRAERIVNGLLPCFAEIRIISQWTNGAINNSHFYRPEFSASVESVLPHGLEAAA
jgi:predicted GIY-YIG superfamily endonuclease